MQTTKILTALIFGLMGFWAFTQLGNSQARHILITDTAAYVMENGTVALTFSVENTGAPDRFVSAESSNKAADFWTPDAQPFITVPSGKSSLSLESAHIIAPLTGDAPEPGTLLPLAMSLESGQTVTAFIKVADTQIAPGVHGAMAHGAMEIDMGDPPPTISLTVVRTGQEWAIDIKTDHFEFMPDAVDGEHVPGQGHGHLYVSGTKVGRVFDHSATIGALPKGQHIVRVTLNTNNHVAYMNDGQTVSASAMIEVDEP